MPRVARAVLVALLLAGGSVAARAQVIGGVLPHAVQRGETMTSIAARYGLSRQHLAALNGRRLADPLRAGTVLLVDGRHLLTSERPDGIVINLPQRMLFLVEQGTVSAAWPVAAGRPDWPTPLGSFLVVSRQVDPTWVVPPSIQQEMARLGRPVLSRVAPGPGNPLGDRWLGLGDMGVGIHGTNQPASIYGLGTHGCIRLHPDDMRVLFDRTAVGTPVTIVYEPVLVAWVDNRVLVEVHPDAYRRMSDPMAVACERLANLGVTLTREDLQALRAIVARRGGFPETLLDQW